MHVLAEGTVILLSFMMVMEALLWTAAAAAVTQLLSAYRRH
jgi:hypothetical protein